MVNERHTHDAAVFVASYVEIHPGSPQAFAQFFLRGFSPKRFIDPATDLPPRVVLPEPFGVALHVPFQPVIPDLFTEQ